MAEEKKQLIGTLKKIDTTSKVDDTSGREIHTVAVKIELIEGKGREHVQDIANALNKPIRLDFDEVQLSMDDKIND